MIGIVDPSTSVDTVIAAGKILSPPPALLEHIKTALETSSLVIVEGAIAWPLVEPVTGALGRSVRRVYLKRMSRTIPDYWEDEEAIESNWPPTTFHRSIYQYHAQQKPWLAADLILERIEEKDG